MSCSTKPNVAFGEPDLVKLLSALLNYTLFAQRLGLSSLRIDSITFDTKG
jgi:hypothetical protein